MTVKREFRIGEHLSLKLEDTNTNSYRDWTIIYVDNEEFLQCHFLLINLSEKTLPSLNTMDSIDEMEVHLSNVQERNPGVLTPEEEFFGHCSNIQAWHENGYDTRLLHRNIAFPLLKKLTEVGDSQAKSIFKEEVAERLSSGVKSVVIYLIKEGYIDCLSLEEWKILHQDFDLSLRKMVEQEIVEVLKTVGTHHDRKEKLFNFLMFSSPEVAQDLEHVKFNEEKFFLNNSVLKIHITKDEKLKIKDFLEVEGLNDLKNLKELFLWNQGLKEIKGLRNLKALEILNLRGNQIQEIKGLEGLKNLRKLILERNLIRKINGISSLFNLEWLDLSYNKVEKIQGIDDLNNLKTLILHTNKIRKIEGLDNVPILEKLHLGWNHIRRIENISKLPNLRELHLYGNYITENEFKKIEWKNREIGDIKTINLNLMSQN